MRCAPDIGGGKPYIEGVLRTLFSAGIKCTMVMEPRTYFFSFLIILYNFLKFTFLLLNIYVLKLLEATFSFYGNFTKSMNALGPSPYIVAWEGPNEPDLFWVSSQQTYEGAPYPQGVYNYQRDLYNYAKVF
jgi:hypothetical protein